MNAIETLSRSEMRAIKGGIGNGCVIYCCSGALGTCSAGNPCLECTGTTNEQCQASAVSSGWSCDPGYYVAALYQPMESP